MATSKTKEPNIGLEFGRIPPQARDMEESVIGACLDDREAFAEAMDIIYSPECFYDDRNNRIWNAMLLVHHAGDMVDILTVAQQLRKNGDTMLVTNPILLMQLTQSVVSSAHVNNHARIVVEMFMKREAIRVAGEILNDAYRDDVDVFDLLDGSELKVKNISAHIVGGDSISVSQSMEKVLANYDLQKSTGTTLIGISSGLKDLDNITGGWRNPGLVFIAAFPSIGKTSLMLKFCMEAAKNKLRTKIFSLETDDIPLTTRMCAALNKLPLEGISKATLTTEQKTVLFNSISVFHKLPISISQKTFFIEDLEKEVRRDKKKNKDLALICVDFIQLLKMRNPGKMGRYEVMGEVSRRLKLLSAEVGVPIIALSQRKTIEKGVKVHKAELADLAGSSELGQNADVVIFIYYENGETILSVVKNKHGKLEDVKVKFNAENQHWSNLIDDTSENIIPGIFNNTGNNFKRSDWND